MDSGKNRRVRGGVIYHGCVRVIGTALRRALPISGGCGTAVTARRAQRRARMATETPTGMNMATALRRWLRLVSGAMGVYPGMECNHRYDTGVARESRSARRRMVALNPFAPDNLTVVTVPAGRVPRESVRTLEHARFRDRVRSSGVAA